MTLLCLDHIWQELTNSIPMADEVDLEDLVKVGISSLGDEVCPANACVVAQYRDCTMLFLDLVGNLFDAGRGCDVSLVIEDLASCEDC